MSSQSLLLSLISFLLLLSPISAAGRRPYTAEKLTHLRLYWQDIASGNHPTSIQIIAPRDNATSFGGMRMTDDALTAGPAAASRVVGRSQGFYAAASLDGTVALMAMTLAFVEGEYNGSSVTVMGRDVVTETVREMPVIGGTGVFRFARGYVEARTHSLNPNGDATVEFDCYVLHF